MNNIIKFPTHRVNYNNNPQKSEGIEVIIIADRKDPKYEEVKTLVKRCLGYGENSSEQQ